LELHWFALVSAELQVDRPGLIGHCHAKGQLNQEWQLVCIINVGSPLCHWVKRLGIPYFLIYVAASVPTNRTAG
jgi:hypothetical protein